MTSDREGLDLVAGVLGEVAELARRVPADRLPGLLDEIRRFVASLTPEQAADLIAGRASVALVDVEPADREGDRS